LSVVINEIAWAGTEASSSDEWIELYNPTLVDIDLTGWMLAATDGLPNIILKGFIPANGYFLLERTNDKTISDIAADQIYTGSLGNSGETLKLIDSTRTIIDSANIDGGSWPGGNPSNGTIRYATMERFDPEANDSDTNWGSNDGITRNGLDAVGDPLNGTPKSSNSVQLVPSPTSTNTQTHTATTTATPSLTASDTATKTVTPTPTVTEIPKGSIRINEVAWAGTLAYAQDEWIELYNSLAGPANLTGYRIQARDGSPEINLSGTISAKGFFLLERTDDTTVFDIPADQVYTGALSNDGETLDLISPSGLIIDTVNVDGGAWPAGNFSSRISMERLGEFDIWSTNNGYYTNGIDFSGNPINGTPKFANSVWFPIPSPTPTDTATLTATATTTKTGTPTFTASPTATNTSTPSATPTATASLTVTNTSSPSATPTSTSSSTPTVTASVSTTQTPTASQTPTSTASLTATKTAIPKGAILINEIAWAGTNASSFDEWIELFNSDMRSIPLTGFILAADDGSPEIHLTGSIDAGEFYLLERTDDNTLSDIAADLIYTGNLSNSGETLRLIGPTGEIIDTANLDGGNWPAGISSPRYSMERYPNTEGNDASWATNDGYRINGQDANGDPILGSPKQPNSVTYPTLTPTITPTPTNTDTLVTSVIINEIAWSGTIGNYRDEWIELYNYSNKIINLENWQLKAKDGSPAIELSGEIQPWGYFLLERTDDTTVADIAADLIYRGSLRNSGETLFLSDPSGVIVDTVYGWSAGDADEHRTMERAGNRPNGISLWLTNNGYIRNGIDVDGYRIWGTPRQRNSIEFPTPTPTSIPDGALILINEFLPKPRYDWNGDGKFSTGDEFIELINAGAVSINLEGYLLGDLEGKSNLYEISAIALNPGEILVLFRSVTGISLSDQGATIRLYQPDRKLVDERTYNFAKDLNVSWCRFPDGIAEISYPCWPTPGKGNAGYPLNASTIISLNEPIPLPIEPALPEIISGYEIPKGLRLCGYK